MASDMVKAQIAQRNITAETLYTWLRRTHHTLLNLLLDEQSPAHSLPVANPGGWRSSIRKSTITCLECGQTYRQLVTTHLRKNGLTAAQYRQRHGMPPAQSLAAKALTQRRRQIMHDVKPWVKATAARWPKGRR
jgi:predicted transcriptional regulator